MFFSNLHLLLKKFLICLSFYCFFKISIPLYLNAFDDSYEINHSFLNQENFLDIKSYQFSKFREEEWYLSDSGWRLTGGSLGLDLLYTNFEARLRNIISEDISVIFFTKQEEFYEVKPFRYLVEVEWRSNDWIAFSLLGMPEYDKRKADQGASLTIGNRPWNFLRFQQLLQDLHYNEKNFYDNSYFSNHPVESFFEGAFLLGNFRTRLSFLDDKEFKLIVPDDGLTFTYNGEEKRAVVDYHFALNHLAGISWINLDFHKSRKKTSSNEIASPDNREQQILYSSIDLYWLKPINIKYSGTVGIREDYFRNFFRQIDLPKNNYDFHLWTLQIYGIVRHQTTINKAWEYAIYAGDTDKVTNFLDEDKEDEKRRKPEGKLRISWEFRNIKNESSLMFSTSWNLDNFFNNFWDGGNISYQRTF